MSRRAFLLGFFSIGAQILIIRELIGAFHGDELFIGTALFGWLIAVGVGSLFWEKLPFRIGPLFLFAAGAVLLPAILIAIRFSPLYFVDTIGEKIPFVTAAWFSIVISAPLGIISGSLFPALSHEGYRPAKSISRIYLFEGIGAFIGGIVVTALIGTVFANMAMGLAISTVTIIFFLLPKNRIVGGILLGLLAVVLIADFFYSHDLEKYLDRFKFESYDLIDSFETPYGHEALIKNKETISLVTDNAVEDSYPDRPSAEELLIPPLAFKPDARNILIIGRTEFGTGEILRDFDSIKVTALDPRGELNRRLDRAIMKSPGVIRINDDPVSYLFSHDALTRFDIIIIAPSEPDDIVYSRYLTGRFLSLCRKVMNSDGLLYLPTIYDSERYVSPETGRILSVIYNTLDHWFRYIDIWPGPTTLFLASDKNHFDIFNERIFEQIDSLPYSAQYMNRYYLNDRLDEFRRGRVMEAIDTTAHANTVKRPVLIQQQNIYNSITRGFDETLVRTLFEKKIVVVIVPIIILVLFVTCLTRGIKHQKYGLFLFFTAGIVSLSLELIAIYLYQTMAGTIYSEIGLLFGAFMFGLAAGTWYALKSGSENLEFPALLLLITIIFIFFWSYETIPFNILLFYHALFLFTTGAATGTLFVAATARYYFGRAKANRGLGYGLEIFGSSLGALFTVTILLPVIGMTWLLLALLALTALALVGAYVSS